MGQTADHQINCGLGHREGVDRDIVSFVRFGHITVRIGGGCILIALSDVEQLLALD